MPLVNAKEMLTKAKAGHYAVGQFNINNLEWTKSILLTAQEMNSPVILGVSEGAGKYMCGYNTVVGMVEGMLETLNITVPVALHLDHGSYEGAKACIEAGFSSIMFDGSHYPIDENIAKTKELVAICEEKGLSIEAEVGSIGGEEDGVVGAGEIADPQECKKIADLEYFCMGERGDQYRGIGWPNIIPTKYMVDPTKEYATLDIHYAYVGANESVQKSEKDITIVCADTTVLNGIIGAINTATGLTIKTL